MMFLLARIGLGSFFFVMYVMCTTNPLHAETHYANLSEAEKKTLDNYRLHFDDLKKFYSNITIEISVENKEFENDAEKTVSRFYNTVYLRDDGYARSDLTINEPSSKEDEGNTNVALLTPDNFYILKKDGSGPYALASKGSAASERGTIISNCPPVTAPYSIGSYTADQYLFNYKKPAAQRHITLLIDTKRRMRIKT